MKWIHKFSVSCFSIFYPSKVHGKENIPEGGAIMVCNHFRACDCGFVSRAYNTDVFFLAKAELFKNKLFGKIVASYGGIPIDRDKPDMKQILKVIRVLKEDHKLVIFPEGTRNKTGTDVLQEIKGGPGVFAVKAKKPIVPMMLSGKAKIFRKVHLIVGEPFELSEFYNKKLTDEDIVEIDNIVRNKMLEQQNKLKELLRKKKGKSINK